MICLFLLRRREPALFNKYRTPLYRLLPVLVVILSAFALCMYSMANALVVPLTAALYAAGLGYFWFWARKRLQQAAPEELAARHAHPAKEGAR